MYSVVVPSLNRAYNSYRQNREMTSEVNGNCEIPIATAVHDDEGLIVLPHAEPNELENQLVIVDAQVIFFLCVCFILILFDIPEICFTLS